MISWNIEYSGNVKTFLRLRNKGEETPLDIVPELDNLEKWFYDSYYRITSLTDSMSGNIDLKTFDLYFKYYPINCVTNADFIDVISTLNSKIRKFNDDISKHKSEQKRKTKG